MAEDKKQAAALKTLLSNPKADIPIFYGDHTKG
jgi:hypothetical protein